MPEIVAIGECMIELFSDEPMGSADTFQRAYAGDTNNVLHMASRLGTSCGYVTRAADDAFGDFLLNAWRDNGIDTSAVRRVPGFTAVHFISLLPGGDREFIYYRKGSAASTMTPDDLDPDYIGAARVLHVGGIIQAVSPSCRATVLSAVQIAGEQGVTVSFDTNLRANMWSPSEAREALDEIVPHVDVLYISYPDETSALLVPPQIPHLDKRRTSLAPATKGAKMFLDQEKRSPTRCSYYEARSIHRMRPSTSSSNGAWRQLPSRPGRMGPSSPRLRVSIGRRR